MLRPIFEFDYWGLPIYNVMVAVGALFALLSLLRKEKKLRLSAEQEEKINKSFAIAGLSSLIFANIVNWFLFPGILNYPLIQRITLGGLSFYYGMFGFFAVATLLLWLQKIDFKFWINEVVPSVLIVHAFGRVGCSLVGCCYGVHINPINFLGLTIDRFPAREIEAGYSFVMYFVFQRAVKKNRLFWYLLSYSVVRFFLEFGRGDDRGLLLSEHLSPAQITSIFVWAALLAWITYKIIRHKSQSTKVQSETI